MVKNLKKSLKNLLPEYSSCDYINSSSEFAYRELLQRSFENFEITFELHVQWVNYKVIVLKQRNNKSVKGTEMRENPQT